MMNSAQRSRLGLATLTALVVANMVGAGVFTTSGFALADLGSPHWVMGAWLLGAVVALCGALSYGGLVRRISESGGEYLFLSRLIHPLAGFVAGWVSLLAGFTGAIAFAALTFEAYAIASPPVWLPPGVVAIAAVVFAALAHGARLSLGANLQNIVVVVKLGVIGAFIVAAIWASMRHAPAVTQVPVSGFSLSAFAASMVWISLSYSGFNAAIYVAGEARDPTLTVPRAMWIGTAVVSVLYLALNAIFVYLPPFEAVVGREDVATAASLAIGGESLARLARGIISLALLTSIMSMMMAGPRVYARMADDGVFPRMFRFDDLPRSAIALQATLAIVVILIADLRRLLTYLGFTLSLSAALTVASLFVLHRREGRAAVNVVAYPLTPGFFIVATMVFALLAAQRNPIELAAAVVTIGAGCVLYWVTRVRTRQR